MTKPDQRDIEVEIAGADEELATAKILYAQRRYRAVITHCYYGMFHAARAVLWEHALAPKTHKGLIRLFNEHLVKTGRVDSSLAAALQTAHDDRNIADYLFRSESFGEVEASELLVAAQEFVSVIKNILSK